MSLPITPIHLPALIPSIDPGPAQQASRGEAFQSILSDALGEVQQAQNTGNAAVERYLSGENQEVHQIAIDTQKTSMTLGLVMAVRNKVVTAYQQVMQMQM